MQLHSWGSGTFVSDEEATNSFYPWGRSGAACCYNLHLHRFDELVQALRSWTICTCAGGGNSWRTVPSPLPEFPYLAFDQLVLD